VDVLTGVLKGLKLVDDAGLAVGIAIQDISQSAIQDNPTSNTMNPWRGLSDIACTYYMTAAAAAL
jgi:hypothetical protein